ncbi:MAG: hypothetical protein DRI94_12065 [Bacteroidetes bacterium]|nr:MAG: hypothetical protein DRI94_12065 [Bacteroidota bacterium]
MKKYTLIILTIIFFSDTIFSQELPYNNMYVKNKKSYLRIEGKKYREINTKLYNKVRHNSNIGLSNFTDCAYGLKNSIAFDFNNKKLNGTLYYGLIPSDTKYPQPVFFKITSKIKKGKAKIYLIPLLTGKYDFVNWQETGVGKLGYRVIDNKGNIIYDGRLNFTFDKNTNIFKVVTSIINGPFVNKITKNSATITYQTNITATTILEVNKKSYRDKLSARNHEFTISNLQPNTKYEYIIRTKTHSEKYFFTTAPKTGTRTTFTFAYASDSRKGNGGGERNISGTNAYIMKKLSAAASLNNVRFFQFSGDLINGYLIDKNITNLQYANWKHSVENFWHYAPVYTSMGNHEVLVKAYGRKLLSKKKRKIILIENFPFKTNSSEAVFADNFCNPENGPVSEDNSIYDFDTSSINFPSYKENVYFYTYNNVAVIVLNSNYWYSTTLADNKETRSVGGNLHAYLMDNQLKWLEKTLNKFEKDTNIDHVFITQHTPAFPNGGHSYDDMWYSGNNFYRPYIKGKPVKYGIIERRDQYLDLLINKSSKVRAILTGDEHNYNHMEISDKTPRYPKKWDKPKVKLSRSILQINNGAAGAPYYAQEKLPWSEFTKGFSTQNAIVLISVSGKKVSAKVINPETFEQLDSFEINR